MSDVVLRCEQLRKVFSEASDVLEVLSAVDLTVKRGERIAIIGASGSGKSTLLHLLGGLEAGSGGTVEVVGQRMDKLSDAARGKLRNRALGFIYQFHHLLDEFTALENVALPLVIRGESIRSAQAAATAVLDKVGLAQRLQHKPAQLSGGERQRAAVARALVTKPACILADEPTGNLDRGNADKVYDLMLALNQDYGASVVIVTHDPDLAAKADRVLELRSGVLEPVS